MADELAVGMDVTRLMGGAAPDLRSRVSTAAASAGLDPDFVSRLVSAESNWNPRAVSNKGAQGLMQLMPGTAKQYGVSALFDPDENIKAGIAYLKDLTAKYPDRPDLVAAAYNAGPGAVDKAGGIPAFKETQDYVRRVVPAQDKSLAVGMDVTHLMGAAPTPAEPAAAAS